MQRLHATVEHFGRAGKILDRFDAHAAFFERRLGAAGRKNLDAVAFQRAREFDQPGFIGDAEQRPFDNDLVVDAMLFRAGNLSYPR